jgi:hypothetical protein
VNTGGGAKVPGPLDDFRLAMSNNDPRGEARLDYAHESNSRANSTYIREAPPGPSARKSANSIILAVAQPFLPCRP